MIHSLVFLLQVADELLSLLGNGLVMRDVWPGRMKSYELTGKLIHLPI